MIGLENFLDCGQTYSLLEESNGPVLYDNVDEWRGTLMTMLSLLDSNAIEISFQLPEKVIDTSDMAQSGN